MHHQAILFLLRTLIMTNYTRTSGSSRLPNPSFSLITYAQNITVSLSSFLSVFLLLVTLNDVYSLSHTVWTGREEQNLPSLLSNITQNSTLCTNGTLRSIHILNPFFNLSYSIMTSFLTFSYGVSPCFA